MKKSAKIICLLAALSTSAMYVGCFGCNGCGDTMDDGSVKLTVWVSEADKPFATEVAEEFKKANPDKNYTFTIDIQGENETATRVLKDVENAADVYSFPNDQIAKLVNGDALTKIAGDRLTTIEAENDENAMRSAKATVNGEEGVYGIPYTDNTFFLYYNKSVLTEEDVKTVDGILAKCSDTKKFAFPMTDGWYTTSFYFGKDLGYEVTYDESLAETSIKCDFDGEMGQAVTQAMWEIVQNTKCKPDANDSKITAGFNDGSIVAAATGIWNRSAIESYLGDNFAVAKLPTYTFNKGAANEEQVQMVSFAGYKLMGVNNYSKNKADALAFAEFYTNKENQIKHFEMRGYVPTNLEARQDEGVQADVCAKAITEQLKYSKPQINVPSTLWVPMEGLGNSMITALQSGSFDLQAQLKACVDAIKK